MSKQRKFVLIAALAGIISMFLSWGEFSLFGNTASVSGLEMQYGFLPLLCFIGAGIIAFWGTQTENLKTSLWFVSLICGAIATLYIIMRLTNMPYGLSASLGIFLAAIAAIGILAAAFLFRSPTDTLKSGFDSFKKDIDEKMKNTGSSTTDTKKPSNTSNPNSYNADDKPTNTTSL